MTGRRAGRRSEVELRTFDGTGWHERRDCLAEESPLEIRVAAGGERRTLAVTMRTPGHDRELAAGFLYGEGLVRHRELIAGIAEGVDDDAETGSCRDVVEVALAARRLPELRTLERHFFTGSACGVCGSPALDAALTDAPPASGALAGGPSFSPATLGSWPAALAAVQAGFRATGGLHAAARFDGTGRLLAAWEDVGRHNALDKLVGRAFLDGELDGELDRREASPGAGAGAGGAGLADCGVLVSGRASFELVQKCAAAGIAVLCAVSAPTSLAVEVAERCGVTLVGFLRGERLNVYTHPWRVG